jgi:hypothetical protein
MFDLWGELFPGKSVDLAQLRTRGVPVVRGVGDEVACLPAAVEAAVARASRVSRRRIVCGAQQVKVKS